MLASCQVQNLKLYHSTSDLILKGALAYKERLNRHLPTWTEYLPHLSLEVIKDGDYAELELIGDDVRIKQILINVLNNAIKYTKEGSVSLSVQCEMVDEKTCNMIYNVTDTGVGIKPEDIPYLFSAFKRVDEDSNKHIEGTGLGLSIVKQLVDLMGGKVTVNSVYTKGSTFIIEIPQTFENQSKMGQYNFDKSKHGSHKEEYIPKFEAPEARVLIVDDTPTNLMVATKLLRATKVRLDTASGSEYAFRKHCVRDLLQAVNPAS